YQSLTRLVELGAQTVELKRRDVERKAALAANHSGTQVDADNSKAAVLTAELQLQLGRQQQASTLNQLLGNPDLPVDDFPPYRQAKAALDQAQRDLEHTMLKAPIGGTATQVDNIQLGRFVTAGTPVFSVIDDGAPWVDANPKETDITYLRVGQKVEIDVDSFPDRVFHGTVASVSPGTGAQFAILPPQNANDNWVKVVQRGPVRIVFDPGQDLSLLRAGMSVVVDIDTGRRRTFASLFGASPSIARESMTAPIGWVADRYGRKRLFIVCAAGFTVASILCGLAQNIVQMVGFRLLQGAFGAALVPLSQSVLLDSYSAEERGSAMAIWGIGVMLGPIMGPTLGAWLTDNYSWHWVFFINLPIGIFTVAGLMAFMDESKPQTERRFDWFGFLALAVGIGALQLMLDRGEQVGWFDSSEIIAEAIVSVVGFYFFLAH